MTGWLPADAAGPAAGSLAAILAAPGFGASRLHTARPPSAVPVRAVHGAAGARPIPSAADLAVVLLADTDVHDWRLDATLRRAAASGATALLVESVVEPLATSVALADRLGLALVTVADRWSAAATADRVAARPDRVRADRVLRVVRAVREGDAASTVARVAQALDRPCAVVSGTGAVLEASGDVPADLTGLPGGPRFTAVRADGVTVVGALVPSPGAEPLTAVVVLPGRSAAEESAAADALDVAVLALGLALATRRIEDTRVAGASGAVLAELRLAEGVLSPALTRKVQREGWQLTGWHLAVAVRLPPGPEPRLLAEIETALAAEGLTVPLIPAPGVRLGWISAERELDATGLRTLLGRLRAAGGRVPAVSIGAGRLRDGPSGLVASLEEAQRALALLPDAQGGVAVIDGNEIGAMLAGWSRVEDLHTLRTALAPLDDARGDLRRTLRVHLDHNSSLVDTAEALGVHRNTVAERVARIERLLGVGLDDPDIRLGLHIASRLDATDAVSPGSAASRAPRGGRPG